ncbi:MAG: hypothetical protein M5U26_27515 [Planctomycetota bacterium]|nr:hypothetical protein [Planctomycetota bacterium]
MGRGRSSPIRPPRRRWRARTRSARRGYFDLYDGQAGFYLGTHDPKLVSSVFKAAPDASRTWMGFSLLRQDRIKAGGGEATFHAALGAHAGDWHAGALWYKAWFRTVFPDATWPAWTADTDGWMFGNVSFQRPGFQYESMTEGVLRKAIEMGFSHVQVWGSDTAQSCPCYYYPPDDAGGPEAFAKLNKSWREQGGQIGYYILPQGPSTWVFDDACKDFFGTPWERMPDWAAPPGKKEGKAWQWLLENARYGSPARKPPEPKAEWPGEMEKIRASGFRGGYPWAYTAMSAYSKPWRDWLTFWVAEKYAGDFHCTTAYLDTFHTQGYIPEYNPHLGMHGEGRGGYHRSQLAKRILEESRKRNPDFLPIMEMQCDAYQPYMAQQVGSSSMDSEMLRFTHPDHLQFEGQSGSGWGAKRFKRFNSAWMYGTRLDHREEEPWAVEVVRLRNWITRWINEARFLDDLGLEIDGNLPLASQFKGRIMLSESELNGKLHRVLSPDGTRGFLAQFWNRSRRDWPEGNATLEGRAWHDYRARIDLTPLAELDAAGTAPADWIPTRAVLLELGRPPREIRFETVYRGGRPTVEFLVPARQLCGILFVREARGVHSLLSHWDQRDFRQMDVHLYNPTQRAISGEVRAASAHAALETAKLPFSVGPGELATVSFPYADPAALRRPEIVDLEVEAEGAVRKLRAGAYPFMDDPSFEFDRFGGTYHEAAAADGKRSLLAGSKKVLNYRLEPAAKYRLSFAARALEGAFGASVDVNRILGKNNAIDGRYLRFRESFEVNDRDWTRVSFTLLTPAPFHPGNLYFLAGEGKALLLDDFRLEKLPDDAEVEHLPDTVTTMPNARDVK